VRPDDAPRLIGDIGPDYEQTLILSVFRSAAADVTARYMAKDMHSGSRAADQTASAMTHAVAATVTATVLVAASPWASQITAVKV
jgi:hypothetical protein